MSDYRIQMNKLKSIFLLYTQASLSFFGSFLCIRIYEYIFIAHKFFLNHSYTYELAGLFYDTWTWLLLFSSLFPLFLVADLIGKRSAMALAHGLHILILILYIALLIVFSERNTPFDHEFFTRSFKESMLTTGQKMTTGPVIYLPFAVYILIYLLLYHKLFKKVALPRFLITVLLGCSLLSLTLIRFASPSDHWFEQRSAYYLVCNKFNFWLKDSYQFFEKQNEVNNTQLSSKQLEEAIRFYQQNQPFHFTGKDYPLMHTDEGRDVLGGFFHLTDSVPNIVILVVEGLSSDFSGEHAYAGSFTPFLDSLSAHSLNWDNFLSTAPGTFAAHPAISGSLPYSSRGFSLMHQMPDHLSLIKILRENGYYTQFMIGFDPDFDNMGGYIRLQGTDFILSRFPARYKKMGVGSEGWSMGYPDGDLYARSFEMLDSLHRFPYLSIYHTATTHMPYLFDQKPAYEKLFTKKMEKMTVQPEIRKTLVETKDVLETFMYSDDCIRNFFKAYSKRKEFKNTIFIITGDHHIGSFPSTGEIDDYHVPLIIWSPMLNEAKRFHAVNSHNNLTPTITALLFHHYALPYKPKEVHWLGDVLDTCASFRNIHNMPFMQWSREISDYLYKDYFLSGDQLYRLSPGLEETEINNDSIKQHLIALRENFKVINRYVCEQNRIYPAKGDSLRDQGQLLFSYSKSDLQRIDAKGPDTSLMGDFQIPPDISSLYVAVTAEVNLPSPVIEDHTTLRLAILQDSRPRNYLYWSKREISAMSQQDFVPQQWNAVAANDRFSLEEYKHLKNLVFESAIYTDQGPIDLQVRNLTIKIYGIKKAR